MERFDETFSLKNELNFIKKKICRSVSNKVGEKYCPKTLFVDVFQEFVSY